MNEEGDRLGWVSSRLWLGEVAAMRIALRALLDACDYTDGHCDPTEAVCEVVSSEVLAMARKALAR